MNFNEVFNDTNIDANAELVFTRDDVKEALKEANKAFAQRAELGEHGLIEKLNTISDKYEIPESGVLPISKLDHVLYSDENDSFFIPIWKEIENEETDPKLKKMAHVMWTELEKERMEEENE